MAISSKSQSRRKKGRAALEGKRVLITGASSGIGRQSALEIAQCGARVVLVARREDALREVASEIKGAHGTADVMPCDLSNRSAIEAMLATLTGEGARIDVLINNAGLSIRRSIADSLERLHDFERTTQVNYLAAVSLTLGLLPGMLECGAGHIVNISTLGVRTGAPNFAAYVASKAALDHFGRTLALEMAGKGVKVTTINFGLVRTPMVAPTKAYDNFPALSMEDAASRVLDALIKKPARVSPAIGTALEIGYAMSPRMVQAMFANFHDRAHKLASHRDGGSAA